MPTVVIPIGGQNVPIDVQGFASESTQQRIAAASDQAVNLLNRIAANDSNDMIRELLRSSQQQISQLRENSRADSAASRQVVGTLGSAISAINTLGANIIQSNVSPADEQMVELLNRIASEDSGDDAALAAQLRISQEQLAAIREGTRAEQRSTSSLLSSLRTVAGSFDRGLGNLMEGGRKLQGMNASELVQQALRLFSGGNSNFISGTAGILMGVMEKTAASFNTMRRVGAGFGDEMEKLRAAAAVSGMQLDAFGAMLLENGAAVASLGRTTTQGAARFAEMSNAFYAAIEPFGGFSMSMTEINQLLMDEIEARRVTTGTIYNLNTNFGTLQRAVIENARRQEAMARITGQDMRERMAAQVQAREDSRVRAALIGATERVLQNFNNVSASLSRFDPTRQLTAAFGQAFATGFDPMAFAPELMAMVGPGVQQLLGQAQKNMDAMDPGQFARWFESNLEAEFQAMRENEEYMQQLVMMSHSTQQGIANSAQTLLNTLTSFERIQIDRQAQEALERSDTGAGAIARAASSIERSIERAMVQTESSNSNSFAMMQANIERFSASINQLMASTAVSLTQSTSSALSNIIGKLTNTNIDISGNTFNGIIGGIRDAIIDASGAVETNRAAAMGDLISLQNFLPDGIVDDLVQQEQLTALMRTAGSTEQMVILLTQIASQNMDVSEQIKFVNMAMQSMGREQTLTQSQLTQSGLTPAQWLAQALSG